MTSLKAIFVFTLIWSSFVYFHLRRSKLGSIDHPVKLHFVAKKEKAIYFKARELMRILKKETGLHYEWKVVFSKEQAIASLQSSKTDVLIDFSSKREALKKKLLRVPAEARPIFFEAIKEVKFRNYFPKRTSFNILKGLKRKSP